MRWGILAVSTSFVLVILFLAAWGLWGRADNSNVLPEGRPTNGYGADPCGPSWRSFDEGIIYEHFILWTDDGSHLVLDIDDIIWTLDINTGLSGQVADVDFDYRSLDSDTIHRFIYGFHASLRPGDNRIAYSTCEYKRDEPLRDYWGDIYMYSEGYEIAAVNLDGSEHERLTRTEHLDHYPVWSPDGSQIALIVHLPASGLGVDSYDYPPLGLQEGMKLAIMPGDSVITDQKGISWSWPTSEVALYPPVWSPDSQHLAYLAHVPSSVYPFVDLVLHTIDIDDTGHITRIGETTALPTWSPDGEELCFAAFERNGAVIYLVKPDGSDKRELWRAGPDDRSSPISQVSWSPDGSEILVISERTYLLDLETGELRRLEGIPADYDGVRPAAWSPDGSRIAIYNPDLGLITISPDGSDLRVLLEIDADGQPRLLTPTAIASP